MENLIVIPELFIGSLLLLGIGYLVGYLLKLDKFSEERQDARQATLREIDPLKEDKEGS